MLKNIAGIIRIGRNAFLLGNRVFVSRHEELTGTLYSHNGEEAERNKQPLSRFLKAEPAGYAAAYGFGHLAVGDAVASGAGCGLRADRAAA